ncbi:hypothetical protein ACFX13_044621 [Malus domestica]
MAAEKDGQGAEDGLPVLIKLKSAQKCLEKLRNVEGPRRISWDGQVNLFCITKCLNGNQKESEESEIRNLDLGICSVRQPLAGRLFLLENIFKFCGNMVFKGGPNQKL